MKISSADQNRKSAFWWSYFVFLLLVGLLAIIFGEHSAVVLVKSIFYAFGLVALWGLIHNIAIGWRIFWVGYFFLVIAGAIYTLGNLAFGVDAPWPASFWLAVLTGMLITTPQWLALWLYAFRRPLIWAEAPRDA